MIRWVKKDWECGYMWATSDKKSARWFLIPPRLLPLVRTLNLASIDDPVRVEFTAKVMG